MPDVLMPKLSDTMEEGKIIRWLKQPGDAFAKGHAAQALGRIGLPAKEAAGPLAEALSGDDVAIAAPATPMSNVKMKNGSKMKFKITVTSTMNIGG